MNATTKPPTVQDALDEIDACRKPNLAAALVAAQAELHAPAKNKPVTVKMKNGGTYTFEYATLDSIVESLLRPILPKYGLWFTQLVVGGQMVTRILHESGETMDCGIPMLGLPSAPQEAGSVITYFKRYSLCAAFGLVAEEDDDANIAEGNTYTAKDAKGKITEQQWQELCNQADEVGADKQKLAAYLNVPSLRDLPADKLGAAKDAIETKRKKVTA